MDPRAIAGRPSIAVGSRRPPSIEFAIIFPLLAMLVFGMLSGGIVMNRRLSVTHATREAARYGATVPIDQLGTPDAWAAHVRDVAVERSGGVLSGRPDLRGPHGRHHRGGVDRAARRASTDDIDTGHRVQVTATLPDQEINGIFVRVPVTVESDATAKYEE